MDNAVLVQSTHLKNYAKKQETMQKYTTKLVPELKGMSYEKLTQLNPMTLGNRRTR